MTPSTTPAIAAYQRKTFDWMDLLSLIFLAGLAVLPPVDEVHKQLILLAIALLQFGEGHLISWSPRWGRGYVVLLKLLLATLLLGHTGGLSINSSYYPIFYLPVVTAAIYFGPVGTLLWTLLASALYCSYLIPALQAYELTTGAVSELVIRNLFFFVAAIVVNSFAIENRRQTQRYQNLAEELSETNRRLEQAQADARRSERLAALGQLSAGLAHEFSRNPLGIIKGSAELLTKQAHSLSTNASSVSASTNASSSSASSSTPSSASALSAELAENISEEVNRMGALVTRFLDFARPMQLQLEPQSAEAMVDRAVKDVVANWTGPEVRVQRRYESALPHLRVDEAMCERVFINLVQNAYEAMSESGGGTLTITIVRAERRGAPGIEMRFADSGPGVSSALGDQIFNPFMTTKKTGVGLGLAIVSKIVDEHGGAISLAGGAGGATFVVFLPLSGKGTAQVSHPALSA